MEQEFKKWDEGMIEYKTYYNQHRVEDMREKLVEYDNDVEHTERIDNQVCKVCHYISDHIAFQAFTDTYCGICGKKMTFCDSDTDKVCLSCARIHGLCKHCGGRMD
jgi:NADH pyrophosphatase NudC (nudix superfamily)